MSNIEIPDFVRFILVFNMGKDIYSVNIIIEKPVSVNNETTTNWTIEGFCNHSNGMMYAPESDLKLTKLLERQIIKKELFDAEYMFYKTLAQYEL